MSNTITMLLIRNFLEFRRFLLWCLFFIHYGNHVVWLMISKWWQMFIKGLNNSRSIYWICQSVISFLATNVVVRAKSGIRVSLFKGIESEPEELLVNISLACHTSEFNLCLDFRIECLRSIQ